MGQTIWLGAVAYDPKVVTIWEGMRSYFRDEAKTPVEVVLFLSYEAQVQALLGKGGAGPKAPAETPSRPSSSAGSAKAANASRMRPGVPRKLTFAERRELDALPDAIEALEREQHALTERMSRPDYHREGGERIKADRARAAEIEHALAAKFERWAELDSRTEGQR